jgi:hypothetical protein
LVLSVIGFFMCSYLFGWFASLQIGFDRAENAVVLAGVKDAARRFKRSPEDGPSLRATVRDGTGGAGRD